MNTSIGLSKVYISKDSENYQELGVLNGDVGVEQNDVNDDYKAVTTLSNSKGITFTAKIGDKYWYIYKRTKKRRIKKKALRKMHPLLAKLESIKKDLKENKEQQ